MDARSTSRRGLAILLLVFGLAGLTAVAGPAAGAGHGKGGRGLPKGKAYLPSRGKIFTGVSDTGQSSDYREFREDSRAHPAVMQSFESWGYIPREAMERWTDTNTRGMLSLSTAACWKCHDVISPQSIARGKGDRYIVALARALAHRRKPTYIRLMPEMNGYWNRYSAFESSGEPRDKAHSTKNFKKAWRRFVLITRGGERRAIDRRLRKLGMPRIRERTKSRLPQPKVAFAWVPQSAGSPDVKGNQPKDYFPGWDYVDWVGADIYGKYPNLAGVNALYRRYSRRPFMIGEWSPWDTDRPGFVKDLFGWVEKHGRAAMTVYYQGFGEGAGNPFELADYPRSRRTLRHVLNSRRYLPFAPENGHEGGKGR
ncbi:MAG: hypothetical protein R2700_15795 [Solirubrobacterales bacterium]